MRVTIVFFWSLFAFTKLFAQTEQSFPDLFRALEQQYNVRIFYLPDHIPSQKKNLPEAAENVESAIEQVLAGTSLSFLNYQDYAFIIAPKDQLDQRYDQDYFERKAQLTARLSQQPDIERYSVGNPDLFKPGNPIQIQGFLTDDATEEPIVGASLLIESLQDGTRTNEIGKYELSLPSGTHELVLKSFGYMDKRIQISVFSSGDLDVQLSKEALELGEVVITAEKENENVSSNDIGLEKLSVEELKRLPTFLGEADVMKSLLLLPGVSSVGEGSSGINVRGGTVDQNLIMQEGMYLFNSTHVLGLFSLFNPDMIENVNLYKGSMPARYGGRLSAVMDIDLKDGNYQQFSGKGGLGLVSSRLTFEGPIRKGSTSFILGTRLSFSDYLFRIIDVAEIQESSAFFYDTNFKFSHRFKNKGKWTIGAYLSQDRFKFSDEFDFRWRTTGLNSRFHYLLSDQLSLNIEGVFSQYQSQWDEPGSFRAFQVQNGIRYIKVRPEINWQWGSRQNINIGLESNFYTVDPGEINPVTDQSVTIPQKIPTEFGRDLAVYIQDDIQLNEQFSISAGLRYVWYQSLGPGEVSIYASEQPKLVANITGTEVYEAGDVMHQYSGLEPRLSIRFSLNESASFKASYNRTQQFINQISNTTAISPVDIWQLSNVHLQPLKAHNYSMGFFKNFQGDRWESSVEVFYRDIDHLIEYKDLADLLINDHLETEIIPAIGRSYGLELSLKKTQGRFTAWFGYTYSRTERKTTGTFQEEIINHNQWYLSNFDRPHDGSMVLTFQANKRSHFAMNFVYSSGRPITAPVGSFTADNIFNIGVYSERNAFRIPSYHRLDISYTIGQSHRKKQAWRSSWTFSIFNVYARKNPYSVFFTQRPFQNPQANRLAVLGTMIPSITYNFSF